MAKKLVKRGSEVTSNSDAICKVTGLRHCDDSTKKRDCGLFGENR